jgi:hypothetical protein
MSRAEEITRAFGGDWHGDWGTIPTPGHSTKDRGTTVRDADDGDVVFNSFNGADWRELKDECRRRGLLPAKPHNGAAQWRVTGEYLFRDEDGAVLYRTRRHEREGEAKRFTVEHPACDAWVSGIGKARRVLYRLPELLAADPAERVYLVEGERKADKLASWGLTATAVAFGCKGWRKAYAEALADRTVVILPDNDDPGREFARRARADIEAAGGRAVILELPGLPPGGDVMDWAGTADDLRAVSLDDALETRSLPLPVEMFGQITPRLTGRHLIKGLLLASTQIVIFGWPGCGKSFLAIDWALHIPAGLDWFGHKVEPGACLYIAAEGQAGVRLRVDAWKRAHGFEGREIPFALVPTAVDLFDPEADLEKLETVVAHLYALWGRLDLIVIDTLAATIGEGDECTSDMATYVRNVARLCAPYDCARAIVHHQPLDGDKKRPRGHGSLWGSSDTCVLVTGDREAPARRASFIKQKDVDPPADILFALKRIELGVDEDGDAVSSCIVEESEFAPAAVSGKRRLTPKEMIVKAAIERALVASGAFPPSEIPDAVLNRARTNKAVRMQDWRAEALPALASSDTKPDTARRTFDRARESLQAVEIIGVWEDWAWLNF